MVDSILYGQIKPQSFSIGIDNLLKNIRPHGRPETECPTGLNNLNSRQENNESLHAWFKRIVDTYCNKKPMSIGIEENIAVIATFKWKKVKELNKDRLIYASIAVLVTNDTLEKYYDDGNCHANYFRLDLNYETLGDPFSHPLPHIHVGDNDAPRFSLDGGNSGNVVMDFLEFIYRNYVPVKWIKWARSQWLSEGNDQKREQEFDNIINAFKDGQFPVLRANVQIIQQIKITLRAAKDSVFKSHMDDADREILEYPPARKIRVMQ